MTSIEWTDETWNPTDGCSVCSPGCANCYAMRFAGRFAKPGERYHGLVAIGKNKRSVWTGVIKLDSGKLAKPLRWMKPRRVFVNSMSDMFHENLTNEQIAAVFGVMAACPQHTFQVLTKRARRMCDWFDWLCSTCDPYPAGALDLLDDTATNALAGSFECCHLNLMASCRWPLPNVWLGVSVENQAAADERIPELLAAPAASRFLSCEPLLGSVDLSAFLSGRLRNEGLRAPGIGPSTPGVDWVIAGCESGPGARPCATSYFVSLRDQCADAGVPFFLKQAHPAVWVSGEPAPSHTYKDGGVITAGPGSTHKSGGVISLPYLYGKQHAEFPG